MLRVLIKAGDIDLNRIYRLSWPQKEEEDKCERKDDGEDARPRDLILMHWFVYLRGGVEALHLLLEEFKMPINALNSLSALLHLLCDASV